MEPNSSRGFHSRVTIPDQDVSLEENEDTMLFQNTSQASIYGARMSVGVG